MHGKRLFGALAASLLVSACGGSAAPTSAPASPASAAASAKPASAAASAKPAGSASAKPAASASAKPGAETKPAGQQQALAGGSAGPPAPGQFTDGNPYLAKPGEAPVTVKAGWCAVSAGFLQLYVARDYGLFQKYGINIQTGGMNAGADAALAATTRGDYDFMYCAAAATIPGLVAGHEVTLLSAPLVGLPYVAIAKKEYTSIKDMKGKKAGISRPGDLDERLTREMLKANGLPQDWLVMQPAGGQTERYTNLLAGVVDTVNVTPPLEVQAKKDGLNVIYKMKDLPIPFIYSAMHASNRTVREKPQVTQRFLAAIAESVWWINGHKAEAEESIRKQLNITDAESLDSAYQAYAKDYVNPSIDVPMKAVQDTIDFAKTQGTPVQKEKPEQITDLTFVKDLQTSGFLEKMWGKKVPPSQ